MSKGSDPSTDFFMPPTMVPAGYGYESELMQNWLPGITGMGSPAFQGQVDPGLSPTNQAAIHSAQQFATSAPQNTQNIMGFLGNMMGGGAAFSPQYNPNLSDYTLQQFMQPPGGPPGGQQGPWGPKPMNLGMSAQGGTGPGGGIFSPPGGGDPFGRQPYGNDNITRPTGQASTMPGSGGGNPFPPGYGGGYGGQPGQQYQTPGGATGYTPYPQPPGYSNMPPYMQQGAPRDQRQQIPVGPGGYQSLPGYQPSGGGSVPGRAGSEARTDPYRDQGGGGAQAPMPTGAPDATGGAGGLGFTPSANNSLNLHGSYRPLVDAALGSGSLAGMQRGGANEDWRLSAMMDYGSLGSQLDPLMNQWGQATDPAQKAALEQQARGMIEGSWNALPEQARSQQYAGGQGNVPQQWMQQFMGAGGGGGGTDPMSVASQAIAGAKVGSKALQSNSVNPVTGLPLGFKGTPQEAQAIQQKNAQSLSTVQNLVRGGQQMDQSGQQDSSREGDPLMKNWYYNMPVPYEGQGALLMPRIPTSQFGGYGIPAYQPIQGAKGFLGWDPQKGILPTQGANVGSFHNPSNKFTGWPTQPNPTPKPTGPGGPWQGQNVPGSPPGVPGGDPTYPGPGGGDGPPGGGDRPGENDPFVPADPGERDPITNQYPVHTGGQQAQYMAAAGVPGRNPQGQAWPGGQIVPRPRPGGGGGGGAGPSRPAGPGPTGGPYGGPGQEQSLMAGVPGQQQFQAGPYGGINPGAGGMGMPTDTRMPDWMVQQAQQRGPITDAQMAARLSAMQSGNYDQLPEGMSPFQFTPPPPPGGGSLTDRILSGSTGGIMAGRDPNRQTVPRPPGGAPGAPGGGGVYETPGGGTGSPTAPTGPGIPPNNQVPRDPNRPQVPPGPSFPDYQTTGGQLPGLNTWGAAQDPISTDLQGYYDKVMNKVQGDITKQTGEAMGAAGFGGNRYSSSAMDQVADVVGRNMAGVSQDFSNIAYQSGQDAMNRRFQGNQGDLARQLQATGMGQDMQRFLYGLQSGNANQGLDRMMQAAQMGLAGSGQMDQQMMQRLAALQQAGTTEQERADFYNQQSYQDFENNKWGTLPMLPAFMGGQPIQNQGATAVQTPGSPGTMDYMAQAASMVAPFIPLMMMSDRTLKKDITDTGTSLGPFAVKEWTWRDDGKRDRGLIAQDVERYAPHAVVDLGGKKAIHSGAVLDFLYDYAVRQAKPVAARRA